MIRGATLPVVGWTVIRTRRSRQLECLGAQRAREGGLRVGVGAAGPVVLPR